MEMTPQQQDALFQDITADKIGIVRLDDRQDTEIPARVREIMPSARSVVLLASEVFPEVIRFFTSKRNVGDLYFSDLATRNMEIVSGHLDWDAYSIVKQLHTLGYKGVPTPADGAPFSDRDLRGIMPFGLLAQMAGMGKIGWHSMLLTPEYGARVRLSALITDAPLAPTAAGDLDDPCPSCGGACVEICPAGAISRPEPGKRIRIERYKCSATINASGGCSECLKICPAGRGR
jgi:epoxyqueuosine reductase QueG